MNNSNNAAHNYKFQSNQHDEKNFFDLGDSGIFSASSNGGSSDHSTFNNTTQVKTSVSNDSVHEGIKGFEFLIPFVNKLQTLFKAGGISKDIIQLPQIVVVGAQSSGKTSVLESLVQKSFLPRGEGITTRCPIVLKLINTSGEEEKGEWCEFGHLKDKRCTNFLEVQRIIADYTKQIDIDARGGISSTELHVTIYSPNVVTLTVVDLPGIVKVAKAGQSEDIEKKILELILQYITPTTSLILAVSAANNDLENSDSLKVALKVDPNRDRTLAVITKLDLAPDHRKLKKELMGVEVAVKLGVIGVINKSEKDIQLKKSFKEVIEGERTYLLRNFPSIASQNGTSFLAHQINRLLLTHIEKCFPDLDKQLKELSTVFNERISELGTSEEMSDEEKRETIINIVIEFAMAYKAQVDGRSRNINVAVSCGGARIDHIFFVNLIHELQKLSPLVNISNKQIIVAIRNSRQIGSRLFIPEDAFQELAKMQIGMMCGPVVECAKRVYEEMIRMVPECLSRKAARFPKVNRQITHILGELLHKNFQISVDVLEQYIDIQSKSAITTQADFYEFMEESVRSLSMNGIGKLPVNFLHFDDHLEVPDSELDAEPTAEIALEASDELNAEMDTKSKSGANFSDSLSEQQLNACRIVRELISKYFTIVLHQVQDFVPKSLLCTLVYATVDNVYQELTKKLINVDKIIDLMKESECVIAQRKAVSNDLQTIEEACKTLELLQEECVF